MHKRSLLQTSVLKSILLASLVLPPLALAGCNVSLDEAQNCQEGGPAVTPTFVHDLSKEGLVQAALTAAGANFVNDDYRAVIINVDGSDAASLEPIVAEYLGAGKQIVLDSNGGDAERAVIAQLTDSFAQVQAEDAAVSITEEAGELLVTPIDTVQQFDSNPEFSGNAPLSVLAAGPGDPCADPQLFASDTKTVSSFQRRGQSAPRAKDVLIDSNAIYDRTGYIGGTFNRYIFVGPIQACRQNNAEPTCEVVFTQSHTRSISHSVSFEASLTAGLTEVLEGGLSLGYELTVGRERTIQWENHQAINRGEAARPVSYVVRRKAKGNIRNAYHFQSRRKVHSPCRPSGGCYRIHDTYVRKPTAVVGTWTADQLQNDQPTSDWSSFSGSVDPHNYPMD